MIRKLMMGAAALAISLPLQTVSALSNRTCPNGNETAGLCQNYIDENNDGICDHRNNRRNRTDGTREFIDLNGDGICDNFETGSHGAMHHQHGRR